MRRFAQLTRAIGGFAALSLLLLSPVAIAQDWNDEGSITSRRYQRQIREGNQVAATEFFTLEYSVQTMLVLGGRGGPVMVCVNRCKGNVHAAHEDCDDSCDDTCTEEHKASRRGRYEPDRSAMRAATRAANALAVRAGGTHSPRDWSSRVSRSLANLRREARKKITWRMPHADACSGRNWWVGTRTFRFIVRGTMTKVGFTMRRGVRTPIHEVVGSHEQTVATGEIAQLEPHRKHTWENCKCKPIKPFDMEAFIKEFGEMFKDYPGLGESTGVGTSGVGLTDPEGEEVDEDAVEIEILPLDLNGCFLDFTNGTEKEISVSIPIGTVFDSVDPAVQDMATVVRSTGVLPAGGTLRLYVSLNPRPAPAATRIPIRWACLEMGKRAPKPGDRFSIKPPEDDVVQRLASITNSSRFRGPQDQARMWIYTDKASIDQINERLSPPVSNGRYSTLLWQIAEVGGVDLSSGEYRKCLEPKLLVGIPMNDRATTWLINELIELDARRLVRFIDQNSSDLIGLMGARARFAPLHLSTMLVALSDSDNKDAAAVVPKFLKKVPEEYRTLLAEAGALRALTGQLASGDRRLAEEAIDVLMQYPAEYANDILGAQWEQLENDGLKNRVREHLGIEDQG